MRFVLAIAIIAVIFGPVAVKQIAATEGRQFSGTRLDDTSHTEIGFHNATQALDLGGLLFAPPGDGPFPAVVIIHGSGTSRRDNRWYLTLTEHLQRNGIVVLLPDKRGSGKSQGDWRNASFADLATDTLAAVRFLRAQQQVPVSDIGIIGMSQGGWIAPIVAGRSPEIEFIVSIVGAAVTPERQLMFEENHNLRQMGFLPGISNLITYASTAHIRNFRQRDFWDANGDFDPLPYWRELAVDALALFGEDDSNVPTAESVANLRALGNDGIEIVVYQGSGHALETPEGLGDSIFREDARDTISSFINSVSARR